MADLTIATEAPGERPEHLRGGRLLRLAGSQHALGWADQLAVSGTGFLVLLLVSAWSGIGELGIYSLCVSVLALGLATQESLITRPYTVQMYEEADKAAHATGALMASTVLSISVSVLLLLASAGLTMQGDYPQAASVALALAFAAPFVLLREFARRFAFANQRSGSAFLLDTSVAVGNVLLLIALAAVGWLNATTATVALGLSCGAGFGAWLARERSQFPTRPRVLRATFQRSWGMGRWLLAAQLAMQVQGYTTHWMTMVIAGPVVTGAYAACVSMVALANPLLFGFFNVMIPKSARVFNASGRLGLRRQTAIDALLLGAMMGAFCLFIALFGESVMAALFPAAAGYGGILLLLALASAAGAVGVPASTALASAGRAHAVAIVTMGSATLTLALVWGLMNSYGLGGAAVGILIAEALGSAGRWGAFLLLVPAGQAQPDKTRKPR